MRVLIIIFTFSTIAIVHGQNGQLIAWGNNTGDGTDTYRENATEIGLNSNWLEISSGLSVNHAINTYGELYVWGTGGPTMGTGNEKSIKSPFQIATNNKWSKVNTGWNTCLAIDESGSLYWWGIDIDNTKNMTPTKISKDTNWVDISSGATEMLAINSKGELYRWGSPYTIFDSTWESTSIPQKFDSTSKWTDVATGMYFSLAINSNGEMYSWGQNQYGKLGLGEIQNDYYKPTRIGNKSNWVKTAAGTDQAAALNKDGELYFWGYLGRPNGLDSFLTRPVQIGQASNWIDISLDDYILMALNELGEIYLFGLPGCFITEYNSGEDNFAGGSFKLGRDRYFKISAGSCGFYALNKAQLTTDTKPEARTYLTVYPNPVRSKIEIKSITPFKRYSIYDLSGQKLSAGKISNNIININTLKAGLYLLKLDDQVVRFVKE